MLGVRYELSFAVRLVQVAEELIVRVHNKQVTRVTNGALVGVDAAIKGI